MPTKSSKYRLEPGVLEQVKWLKKSYELESDADVIRYAVSRLYTDRIRSIEKYVRKSQKPA
jgi:hypothetical protein